MIQHTVFPSRERPAVILQSICVFLHMYTNNCAQKLFKIWYTTILLLSVAHMIQIVRLLALLAFPSSLVPTLTLIKKK
jgi:hypothetical protein